MRPHPAGTFRHGTQHGYRCGCRCGCRCALCRLAKRRKNAERFAREPGRVERLADGYVVVYPPKRRCHGPRWRCECGHPALVPGPQCPRCQQDAPWR